MKKHAIYLAPALEVAEVAMENGIAQSGMPTAGTTGDVSYDPSTDNYEF